MERPLRRGGLDSNEVGRLYVGGGGATGGEGLSCDVRPLVSSFDWPGELLPSLLKHISLHTSISIVPAHLRRLGRVGGFVMSMYDLLVPLDLSGGVWIKAEKKEGTVNRRRPGLTCRVSEYTPRNVVG